MYTNYCFNTNQNGTGTLSVFKMAPNIIFIANYHRKYLKTL